MTRQQRNASQSVRLLYLGLYLAFLFAMNRMAFSQWLPLTSEKGLWFYSGAAALILGSLLITPFFTSPANAISYLVAAIIAVFVFPAASPALQDVVPRQIALVFCAVMLAVCALNILLKDAKGRRCQNIAEAARQIADHLGSPRFVYALIIAYALWEYHRQSPTELLFIAISGLVVAAQQPLETFGALLQRVRELWHPSTAPAVVGIMVAHQTPDLVLIRQEGDAEIVPGQCLLIADAHAPFRIGVALGYFGRDEGLLLRALEIKVPNTARERVAELVRAVPEGCVSILPEAELAVLRDDSYLLKNLDSFIGIVAPDTATERLYFEVVQERDIEQGRLVETFVGEKRVLYQVLDGLTKEQVVQQKNTHGFARGEASQIGEWDLEKRKFKPCNWIPQLNAPVFLKTIEEREDNRNAVGYFPATSYHVEIKSLDELVTHNTAILGILGVGKSMLSIELVERMIAHGIKVICIDLTNQYATELSDFFDTDAEKKCLAAIQEAGKKDQDAFADNPEDGGSLKHLREAIFSDLTEFLKQDDNRKLKIYNPSEISATKQENEPKSYKVGTDWHRGAGLWQVTPVEITRIITETCLSLSQDQMTDKARVCLVFEEAHSLVPEWSSAAAEGDKTATNGTARAILQGRKYGVGCLLITQRTANVTKTILNQCNTIFAMRTFDDTGKDFLSNYIGNKYASKLPTLQERQAVVFGRGSSCENPVMIRLNDREDFVRVFREPKAE